MKAMLLYLLDGPTGLSQQDLPIGATGGNDRRRSIRRLRFLHLTMPFRTTALCNNTTALIDRLRRRIVNALNER